MADRRATCAFVMLACLMSRPPTPHAQDVLSDGERASAIAMGRTCRAPILHITSAASDYDVYVESPFARVALVAATALQMHASLEATGVQRAMKPGYRIWAQLKPTTPVDQRLEEVWVRTRTGDIHPVDVRNNRFFLGTVASHGIVEALRERLPEYTFDSLPPDDFAVIVATSHGRQRYAVRRADRQKLMRVCNERNW